MPVNVCGLQHLSRCIAHWHTSERECVFRQKRCNKGRCFPGVTVCSRFGCSCWGRLHWLSCCCGCFSFLALLCSKRTSKCKLLLLLLLLLLLRLRLFWLLLVLLLLVLLLLLLLLVLLCSKLSCCCGCFSSPARVGNMPSVPIRLRVPVVVGSLPHFRGIFPELPRCWTIICGK